MKVGRSGGQLFAIDHARFLAPSPRTRIFAMLGSMHRLALIAVLVGCDGSGAKPAPLLDASADAELSCTHILQLRTFESRVVPFSTQQPFTGDICVEGRTDLACATPVSDGTFKMCVPSGGDFGLRFTQQGFEKTVYLHGPANPASGAFTITDDTFAGTSIWGTIGGSYPPTTTGHLVIVGHTDTGNGRLANAKYTLTPAETVVYLGDNNLPDTGATTTNTSGVAFVADLAPGDYDIKVTSTLASCVFLTGGYKSPDTTQHARVPVIAGVTTIAQLRCSP
jgi:hypothetical protein